MYEAVPEIDGATDILTEQVHNNLHQYMNTKRLSTKWVSRLFPVNRKRDHVTSSNFSHLFIIMIWPSLVN